MALHPLAAGFAEVADAYERGRPDYPPAVVGALTAEPDAFHWFDQPAALVEIQRVLCPGGGLAVLHTSPDWSGASWAHEVGTLLNDLRPEHPHHDGPPWDASVRAAATPGSGWPSDRSATSRRPASARAS